MRTLFALATFLLFISCNQDSSEINTLRNKVNDLESRMNSFQLALNECQANNTSTPFGSNTPSPVKTKKYSSTSGYSSRQCNGITKKGTRCKRTVKSGLYCYQH